FLCREPAVTYVYPLSLHDALPICAALAAGQGDSYRRRFLEVGVLLIDDVQFLAGRREMQAELLRVVDAMQAVGRQIVLTSDRPRSEEHTSELQSRENLVCRLLLEK